MKPLLSAAAMRTCDVRAVARWGQDALVEAAGLSVTQVAREMLGRLYGRRVAVIAGPGLNGADGRSAAAFLRSRGCRVDVIDVAGQPSQLTGYDLVIDAAFGLGCSRSYVAPTIRGTTRVLAVDLPSGVDADSGALLGRPLRADVTLALGAFKFAHFEGPAREMCGDVRFASLGIDTPEGDGVVTDEDLDAFVVSRHDDQKWRYAITVLAGSPAMSGAAALACEGALCAGASMVHLHSRGALSPSVALPPEIVLAPSELVDPRSRCVVAGPGLGSDAATWLSRRLTDTNLPIVFDADALHHDFLSITRHAPRVLTPHQREFERLSGRPLGASRIAATRELARNTDCVILLKGPVTVVADPAGHVRLIASGTTALATAGTGDVLSGMIGAAIARGHEPFAAAALSAHLHGAASQRLRTFDPARALASAVRDILTSLNAPR